MDYYDLKDFVFSQQTDSPLREVLKKLFKPRQFSQITN
jgi:hypothetical protein